MKKLINLILCAAAIAFSTGALAADTLMAGSSLAPGQAIVSRNGIYVLIMQPDDGNLVLYYRAASSTSPSGFNSGRAGANAYAHMQADGNFVVYRSNQTPFWASNTGGRPYDPGYKLVLTDYGSLLIFDGPGNLIKKIFVDDTNCNTGRQPADYPVCMLATNTNESVTATCGYLAQYRASQMGATVGACY
jgi:hypothetical protein